MCLIVELSGEVAVIPSRLFQKHMLQCFLTQVNRHTSENTGILSRNLGLEKQFVTVRTWLGGGSWVVDLCEAETCAGRPRSASCVARVKANVPEAVLWALRRSDSLGGPGAVLFAGCQHTLGTLGQHEEGLF